MIARLSIRIRVNHRINCFKRVAFQTIVHIDERPESAAGARFICDRTAVHAVSTWLSQNGWTVVTSERGCVPRQFPDVTDQQKAEAGEFLQTLDDHDDVHRVWAALK